VTWLKPDSFDYRVVDLSWGTLLSKAQSYVKQRLLKYIS
jgi:hypothetical protein